MAKKIPKLGELDKKLDTTLTEFSKKNILKMGELKKLQEEEAKRFQHEVRKTTATAIASAFSFIIALFWRDAIQDLITNLLLTLGLSSSGHIAKLIADALVTIIGVLAIMKLSKWGEINRDKLSL